MNGTPLTVRLFYYAADHEGIISVNDAVRHTKRDRAAITNALAALEENKFLRHLGNGTYQISDKKSDNSSHYTDPSDLLDDYKDGIVEEPVPPAMPVISNNAAAAKAIRYAIKQELEGKPVTEDDLFEHCNLDGFQMRFIMKIGYFQDNEGHLILTEYGRNFLLAVRNQSMPEPIRHSYPNILDEQEALCH